MKQAKVPVSDPGVSSREFILLIAALMTTNAFGIDGMLAALPSIARELGAAAGNSQQWIVTVYLMGFGGAQLIYGPLADRYGRKPLATVSMALFALLSLVCAFTTRFEILLAARFFQGVAAAPSRVLAIAIVRDCYAGEQMARVMSLAFVVYLIVPVLAPSMGQAILIVASWRAIFLVLAGFGAAVAFWLALRMRETLHPAHRRPLSFAYLADAGRRIVCRRSPACYTLCNVATFGALFGYVQSVQQIFSEYFRQADLIGVVFAISAGAMGVAALLNSRIVGRFGTRAVSQAASLAFILVALGHVALALSDSQSIVAFTLLQAFQFGCLGMMGSNFSAMAMEDVGDMAGTASSVQAFIATVGGGLVAMVIGQAFDGTTLPLSLGYLSVGLCTLGAILVAEHGRLFAAR